MSNKPEHLDDMKKFIQATYGSPDNNPIVESIVSELPIVLEQAKQVSNNLEHIGKDRLAILFSDRSHAEIILENCVTLNNKLDDGDYHTAMQIAEAFGAIFNNIEPDRFEFAGLQADEIQIITENAGILTESFKSEVKEEKVDETIKLVESMQNLVNKWEMHQEITENEGEKILAEGIELGYARAASELAEIIENLNKSEADEQEKKECL